MTTARCQVLGCSVAIEPAPSGSIRPAERLAAAITRRAGAGVSRAGGASPVAGIGSPARVGVCGPRDSGLDSQPCNRVGRVPDRPSGTTGGRSLGAEGRAHRRRIPAECACRRGRVRSIRIPPHGSGRGVGLHATFMSCLCFARLRLGAARWIAHNPSIHSKRISAVAKDGGYSILAGEVAYAAKHTKQGRSQND